MRGDKDLCLSIALLIASVLESAEILFSHCSQDALSSHPFSHSLPSSSASCNYAVLLIRKN